MESHSGPETQSENVPDVLTLSRLIPTVGLRWFFIKRDGYFHILSDRTCSKIVHAIRKLYGPSVDVGDFDCALAELFLVAEQRTLDMRRETPEEFWHEVLCRVSRGTHGVDVATVMEFVGVAMLARDYFLEWSMEPRRSSSDGSPATGRMVEAMDGFMGSVRFHLGQDLELVKRFTEAYDVEKVWGSAPEARKAAAKGDIRGPGQPVGYIVRQNPPRVADME
jgi:hypothetical protein